MVVAMAQLEEYRQCASECLSLSRRAVDAEDRELLVAMAAKWLDLAKCTATSIGRRESLGDLQWPRSDNCGPEPPLPPSLDDLPLITS